MTRRQVLRAGGIVLAVVIAVLKRSWIIGSGAVVAACVAIGMISIPITNPGEFCF